MVHRGDARRDRNVEQDRAAVVLRHVRGHGVAAGASNRRKSNSSGCRCNAQATVPIRLRRRCRSFSASCSRSPVDSSLPAHATLSNETTACGKPRYPTTGITAPVKDSGHYDLSATRTCRERARPRSRNGAPAAPFLRQRCEPGVFALLASPQGIQVRRLLLLEGEDASVQPTRPSPGMREKKPRMPHGTGRTTTEENREGHRIANWSTLVVLLA